ncbi:MAG: hypothetical protein BGO68_04210 [Candidatus Amoebophilus sp. 36-38]|nr:MAG: hypothetical protein BGO68_04210 [Candidatus Amoebophilus sp. 36-38]
MLPSSVVNAKASERWQCIRTPHYDILFLPNMVREAQRMANTLEALYVPVSKTLHVSPKRIPIILRNQIAISNGFTSFESPSRVEFYTFPPQDYNFLPTNDWLNLLAIHELRHVAQHNIIMMLKNFSLTFLIPDWHSLLEGDAVGAETALSKGGRGRSPYFEILYKINLLERGGLSYYKQLVGSYKHQLPDDYRLGYFMTTYLKRKYGADIISKLLQRGMFMEIIDPFALYTRCKKLTGRFPAQIYRDANVELKQLWTNQLKGLKITSAQPIHHRTSEDYTDYRYPQSNQEGIIVLKSGISTPPQFVKIDDQAQEHIICTPTSLNSDTKFSVAKNKLVWIENMPAISWQKKAYTAIQSYHIETKQFKRLVSHSRYSAVSLSPDARQLVAFETDVTYHHRIVLLDAENGKLLHVFPNPENYYYLTPTWSSDGKHIVAVKHAHSKATITLIHLETGAHEDIMPHTEELIGCPIVHDHFIYYNSAYSGIDNIYAINLKTKQRLQVTSSKYGAYNPAISADGKWLLYNDFGRGGMDPVRIPLDSIQWTPIEQVEDRSIRYYEPLITQENNSDILKHIPDSIYQVTDHKPWENLNFILNLDRIVLNHKKKELGLSLILKDILSRTEWRIGGILANKKQERLFTSFTYKRWKPLITIQGSLLRNKLTQEGYKRNLSKELIINLACPFVWTYGEYTYTLVASTTSEFDDANPQNTWKYTQNYTAHFSRSFPTSPRDIYTPWGQELLVSYTHTPYPNHRNLRYKSIYGSRVKLYFPGLFSHHSLRVGISSLYKKYRSPIAFNNAMEVSEHEDKRVKYPIKTSIDYAFPIAYLDLEHFPLAFLQRLRANIFYDQVYTSVVKWPLHVIGIDLIMDIPWGKVGFSLLYKINDKKMDYNPFFE